MQEVLQQVGNYYDQLKQYIGECHRILYGINSSDDYPLLGFEIK